MNTQEAQEYILKKTLHASFPAQAMLCTTREKYSAIDDELIMSKLELSGG